MCVREWFSYLAPSRALRSATTFPPVTPSSGSRGKKIHPPQKNFFGGSFGRIPSTPDVTFKPPEENQFHPATAIGAARAEENAGALTPRVSEVCIFR
jgi:hypothetical protein